MVGPVKDNHQASTNYLKLHIEVIIFMNTVLIVWNNVPNAFFYFRIALHNLSEAALKFKAICSLICMWKLDSYEILLWLYHKFVVNNKYICNITKIMLFSFILSLHLAQIRPNVCQLTRHYRFYYPQLYFTSVLAIVAQLLKDVKGDIKIVIVLHKDVIS